MKRWISLLCALALAFVLIVPGGFSASAAGNRRIINIVYDDSGSMYEETGRWSQALYAMEVFATMLGEQDEMNVYFMHDYGNAPTGVTGSQNDRVHTLVAAATQQTGNTPFATVGTAADALLRADAGAERWLVVLTDGQFQPGGSPVASDLRRYAEQGLQVVYLAIDSAAEDLSASAGGSFHAFKANSSADILGQITDIANMIFQQQVLPASHIAASGTTMTLDIDIPVKQILVFAQGENIKIGSLSGNGAELKATESNEVLVTDANIPAGENTVVAPGLHGLVQTYTAPEGSPYPKGTYELAISNTSNVEIYYIAGADIDCCLIDANGVEVTAGETHYEGDYGIRLAFVDPLTGESLQSDLLDGAQFHAELTNGAATQQIDESVDRIHLNQGEVSLDAWAVLPGDVTVQNHHEYTVYPEPIRLDLSVSVPGEGYKLAALGPQAAPVLVTATNHGTGERITEAEWNAIGAENFHVKSDRSVRWLVSKGTEVGTWEVRPDYVTDMKDTDAGAVELTMTAEYELNNQMGSGTTTANLTIADYVASELRLEIIPPAEPINLGTFNTTAEKQEDGSLTPAVLDEDTLQDSTDAAVDTASGLGALLNIYTKDEYTGAYSPVTREQRKNLKLDITGVTGDGDKLTWIISSGEAEGTWVLQPSPVEAVTFSLKHLDQVVELNVTVTGVLEDGELVYQGADNAILRVQTMSLLDIIARFLAAIIAVAVFLFLLIGYLGKKKLKWRSLKPYCQDVFTGKKVEVKKKRVLLTYLLPYVPQRAKLGFYVAPLHCPFADMTIKAAGSGSFYVVNGESYTGSNVTLNGKRVDAKALKKKKYTHVTLNNLDGMGNPIGKAHV